MGPLRYIVYNAFALNGLLKLVVLVLPCLYPVVSLVLMFVSLHTITFCLTQIFQFYPALISV